MTASQLRVVAILRRNCALLRRSDHSLHQRKRMRPLRRSYVRICNAMIVVHDVLDYKSSCLQHLSSFQLLTLNKSFGYFPQMKQVRLRKFSRKSTVIANLNGLALLAMSVCHFLRLGDHWSVILTNQLFLVLF
jgi:hypothetical protein